MKVIFHSKIGRLDKLRLFHITVKKDVLESMKTEDEKGSIYNQRFRITLNNKTSWLGGSVVLGNESAYIAVSSARMKELGVSLGDTVDVSLEKDNSKYGLEVPQEWEIALEQDPEAEVLFNDLRMGIQRATIYLVTQLKSEQKRIEKSLNILENIKKSPRGKTTMRHILGKDL